MKQYLKVFVFFMILAPAATTMALSRSECQEAAADLQSMQRAQQSISESLISNHDGFATVLEGYAETLGLSGAQGQNADRNIIKNMNSSAKTFRVRGQNARQLHVKLQKASDQVIAKAIECLRSSGK